MAVDYFPFKVYIISIKGEPELLDSFTVSIKKRKNFSAPEGEAGEEYDPFIKWMEEECITDHPVLGQRAYPLSDGRVVFKFSRCESVVNIDMSPCLGIYDPRKRKVIWTKDWNAGIAGGIRGDTVLLRVGKCDLEKLQKAVVK